MMRECGGPEEMVFTGVDARERVVERKC